MPKRDGSSSRAVVVGDAESQENILPSDDGGMRAPTDISVLRDPEGRVGGGSGALTV